MELKGERSVQAPIDAVWAALNDPAVLKDCISGCESFERDDADAMVAVVRLKVGPVAVRIRGRIEISDVTAPTGCRLAFEGQAGVIGSGRGVAAVHLEPVEAGRTLLGYALRLGVGGTLAQMAGGLVDAAADRVADRFFAAFEARLQEPDASAPAPVDPA